jgi:hypothetical protein
MKLVIDFISYLYMYSTCFERHALIIRSPLTVHTASSLQCCCLPAALSCKKLSDSAADGHQHRKLEAVCAVKGLLMMSA